MRFRGLVLAGFLGLAACATVPPTLDPQLFEAEMVRLDANPSPASRDAAFGELLARTDLTEDQRATALYSRADKRLDGKFNLPGAVADFDAFLAAYPDDARAATATRRKLFATEEIEAAERRLAQLQNLSDWFDDKVLMGDIAAGAARYRTSGLTPNPAQIYLLRESGYVCAPEDSVDGELVHRHGDVPEHAEAAVWCPDPTVS